MYHLISTIGMTALVIGIYLIPFLILSALVVIGASRLMRTDDPALKTPLDYDNRWAGYPKVPGDEGYDPTYKGAFGNLPEEKS
jgi:hypothetical protein